MNPVHSAEWLEVADRYRRQGDEARALEAYGRAAALAQEAFEPVIEGRAMLAVGELRALADDFRGARKAFDEAIGRAMEGGDRQTEADAWFALASVCFDNGISKDGHDSLLEAMALYRELADEAPADHEAKRRLARAIRLYGEHLGILGSESDARQALELARIMYQDIGDEDAAHSVNEEIAALREYAR